MLLSSKHKASGGNIWQPESTSKQVAQPGIDLP